MKIGFDAKRLLFNQTGLGNYSRQWIEALNQFSELELELYAPKKANFSGLTVRYPQIPLLQKQFGNVWRITKMGRSAEIHGCDIFHGLSNEIPRGRMHIPRVCTIHDVIFKQFPQYYKPIDRWIYDHKTQYACSHAQAIIVTSETTKQELLKYYQVEEALIHVVYQSINPNFRKVSWEPQKEKPYLIYHSSFNPRKNHDLLIRAFAQICNDYPHTLKLVGTGNGLLQIKQIIKELGVEEKVEIIVAPSNDTLINLLKQASGFVYPSLQEGFGIPLVEAATIGVPMIVSDIPVFRELSGNAAVGYFDPYSQNELQNALIKLLKYHDKENKLNSGFSTLKEMTQSSHMAHKAVEIYRSLL